LNPINSNGRDNNILDDKTNFLDINILETSWYKFVTRDTERENFYSDGIYLSNT